MWVKDDRPSAVLRPTAFRCPIQAFCAFLVCFHRSLIDQLVHLRAAIAGIIALRTARVVFIHLPRPNPKVVLEISPVSRISKHPELTITFPEFVGSASAAIPVEKPPGAPV